MSLSRRVSLFFLAALALILAGFSTSLYIAARGRLDRQVNDRLAAGLDTLAAACEIEQDGVEWEPDEHRLTLGTDTGPEEVRWVVCDADGRLVGRSANLASYAPWLVEFARPAEDGDAVDQADPGGRPWRLARRRLRAAVAPGRDLPPERHGTLVLTVGASREPMDATLRFLAATLLGLSAGLWLAAAVVGRWACRWALAPVSRLAAAARSTDATKPGLLLPRPGTRDELDELALAFNGLLGRLGEALERQRRFTGDASHQLRTPLTAMLGQAEVALRRDRPAEEYRRALSQVHAQAEALHRIVEALLFLARADAEAALPGVEAVDLSVWLPDRLAHRQDHGRDADLRVDATVAGPLWVRAQPVLLGVLVDNLVDNALKYSEAGAPVSLSVRRDGDTIALAVEDGGLGIARDDLPHVFEPFYRSPEARRLGRNGVGLGLAVARRLTEAFGGVLTAESTPGQGSRFTLRLPAARDMVQQPDAPAGEPYPRTSDQ